MINVLYTEAFDARAAELRAAEAEHTKAQAAFDAARTELGERAKALTAAKQALRSLVEEAAGARVWP